MIIVNLAAALAILVFGREIFVPLAIAFVFATVLRPVIRRLEGWHVPAPAGAGMIVVTALLMLWGVGYALTPAVQGFVHNLPDVAVAASAKLKTLPRPLDQLGTMLSSETAVVQRATSDSGHAAGDSVAPPPRPHAAKAPPAVPAGTSLSGVFPVLSRVFGTAAGVASSFLAILLLIMFFLAVGGDVRKQLIKYSASSRLAKGVLEVGDEVQSIISHYVSLLTLINLAQGIAIAIAMALIGMPAPPVWGAMAFVAEFFPYLGSATMVILLTLVGLASSNGPHVLVPPALYVVMTTLQSSVVSPVTYGRSLHLNPAAILVSVMLWWLMWGVMGAFLAVPILATIRVVCERQGGSWLAVGALIEG